MQKFKKQMEAQVQEIVFFASLLLSFTIFLSGIFFLSLTPESISFILGSVGSAIIQGLISTFGFAFFYLSIMSLHMGYITNMHVFTFKDFKREYHVLLLSAVAHIIILTMLATLLSVVQIYFEMPHGEVLNRGTGGLLGFAFGQILFAHLGLGGSILVLLSISFGVSLFAGFFSLQDVATVLKEGAIASKEISIKTAQALREVTLHIVSMINKEQQFATVSAHAGSSTNNLMTNSMARANTFIANQIHHSKKSISGLLKQKSVKTNNVKKVDKTEKVEEKTKMKKAVVRKTATKALKIQNSLKSLTSRKPKKKIVAAKKSSKDTEATKR